MSNEVTIKPTKYKTCTVFEDPEGDVQLVIKDTWSKQSLGIWFSPEEWDEVVAAMAKARKERA